jgi:3-oxoacyl-[acyl-carrier-protein] synthase II
MTQRMGVTGMKGVTAFGNHWHDVVECLKQGCNAVRHMDSWLEYQELNTHLAAPINDFTLPEHYTRQLSI